MKFGVTSCCGENIVNDKSHGVIRVSRMYNVDKIKKTVYDYNQI
jgi:hypothetical protein